MRVLLIDVNCKNSSTGKLVYQIYQNVNDGENQCAVCYGRGDVINEPNIYKFGLDWETNIHALLTRITGYTGKYSFFSTKRLIRFIESFRPDIVHIHEMHAYFLNISMLLKYLSQKDIKTIFTLHCEFDYTGKCGHALECEKWKTRCGKCPHLLDYPRTFLLDRTSKMHKEKEMLFANLPKSTITVVSPWLADRVSKSFLKDKNIEIIYNGIDTSIFYRRNVQELKDKLNLSKQKTIVAVAPHIMNREKGGLYVESIAKIMPEYSFVIVGTDESVIRTNGNITYVPKVSDQDELACFYSIGDLFIICSIKETFSLTCAEAICCGTPVVGFECGAPELIFQEPYAHFVQYGDIDQLVNVINREIEHRPDGIETYAKNFSSKKMLDSYLKLYQKVMAQ